MKLFQWMIRINLTNLWGRVAAHLHFDVNKAGALTGGSMILKKVYLFEKRVAILAVLIFFLLAVYHYLSDQYLELSIWISAIIITAYLFGKNKQEKENYLHSIQEWDRISQEQKNIIMKMESMMNDAEKLGLLGELAAGIAHEVRNPLTTLKGFLQLMNSDLDDHKKSFIDLMLAEVDRIEMITDEFMSVARPHAPINKEENIISLLEQVKILLEPQALLKNVQVLFSTDHEIVLLNCGGNQLKQVFINIMKNAFDAMPTGGKLFIIARKKTDSVVIQFIDEGIGMSDEVLAKLGEPFFTQKEGGHGLGIMMCNKIIDAHNGKLEIQSKVGGGTNFTIHLPKH
jgi:signal transduction histidine kinase